MDDVEGYGEELEANVYDDDYLSSEGENVADVTIDLLEDEEFPDLLLDQEEMSHHALATSSYDHELEDPTSRHSGQTELNQSHLQQQRFFQQQQPQSSEGERSRESISKSLRERERDAQQPQIVKTRKSEAFSRLPMPRSSQSSGSASGIPTLQHRHSQSSHSSRNNTNNTSPQLGNKSREVKSSPSDVVMSPGVPNDYVSQKGSGHTVSSGMASSSPNPIKHSPINTKLGYQSSMPSNNGPMSSITGNNDLNNYIMASPTSPKITAPSIVNGNGNADRDWTVAEMNDFLIEHRNQLRECGDLTKRETKLLANVTLGMSSPAHAQSTGYSVNKESFMKYISELDEIVDEKLITIVAMSHKLKALRGHT
ncbi:hypothetical protein BCR41DRAFT_353060 [Lobosporangium transversale]|uniref:Uncharacterized protein n=1 Tax=Lobosporangium transversale TaxID=64571 RepID=A0A1Y2GNP2_9FUNG|nr:hypothetical protein BCR41DRAFT_353060 [Lobosporangium transversale]ORZ16730.1 hypothetical protein BCR41DRAFT_353060 [Lobosporangium transversale]|eukprot:XP_021881665.1 hypothetical protein BCR41DRAFT_353060 [Lobosporangium transversale]